MKENLSKIDNWLQKNAERILKYTLCKPATVENFEELEKLVGQSLPNDFKELYLWHNGSDHSKNFGSLFYGFEFLSLTDVVQEYTFFQELQTESDLNAELKTQDGIILNEPKNWVKFCSDGSRSGLYLNMDSETSNQIIFVDLDYHIAFIVADSLAELVSTTISDMEKGLYYLAEDALEDGNHWLNTVLEIDVLNWHRSERWTIGNKLTD